MMTIRIKVLWFTLWVTVEGRRRRGGFHPPIRMSDGRVIRGEVER